MIATTQASVSLSAWQQDGEIVELDVAGSRRAAFVRVDGPVNAPWVTLLHGFPFSSLEWAPLVGLPARERRVLSFDFLGYGASGKPPRGELSFAVQADLVLELWRRFGVTTTAVVAYDIGSTVACELLAREQDGVPTPLEELLLANSGLFREGYRPKPIQKLLAGRLGPLLDHALGESTFATSLGDVFSREHPLDPRAAHEHWLALQQGDGSRLSALVHDLHEAREHSGRWEVSGAVRTTVARRRPDVPLTVWPDNGHCLHQDTPERFAAAVLDALARA